MVGAIQAIFCDKALLQYNESAFTHHGLADGDGIVIDSSTNSIAQFNYTHDNDGGGFFVGAERNTISNNNVVRYNISQNDGRATDNYGGIFLWAGTGAAVNNTDVYGNTVYMSPNASGYVSSAFATSSFNGTNLQVRNNIFVTSGGSRFIKYTSGGTGVVFQGNDYWGYNSSAFVISWRGTTFTSLASWRSATSQEMLNSAAVGFNIDPGLTSPGTGGTIGNADQLTTLTAYKLVSSSPLKGQALDLSQFGTVWDPFSFATDSFFTGRFSTSATDYYGLPLTTSGTNSWSIGANVG